MFQRTMLTELLKIFTCHSVNTIDSKYLRLHYMLNLIVMSALLLVFAYCRCLRPRISCLQKERDSHINPVFIVEYCWDHLMALTNNFTGEKKTQDELNLSILTLCIPQVKRLR